jgi:glycosyltransferase involved in cell wall biosynthesis
MQSRPVAFVLLARGFGAATWNRRFHQGKIIGLNEEYAYGYHHADKAGVDVRYSEDFPEGLLGKLLRLGARAVLGFDLVHAWRNRDAYFAADVVWTHTESQSLAAGLLRWLYPRRKAPQMILQSVWICDQWDGFSRPKQWLYRKLLSQASVLTFHSPLNLGRARELFVGKRCELVRFGIAADHKIAPTVTPHTGSLQVLALGNDRHRDWPTLVQAVRGRHDLQLTIVSATIPKALVAGLDNCRIVRPTHNDELNALFADADVVVVPLQPNLHASGITVLEESVIKGRPVVVSDVGGLRAYFGDEDVWYVPAHDPVALQRAIDQIGQHPEQALAKAITAQAKTGPDGLSSKAFAREHVRLSLELMNNNTTRQLDGRLRECSF